MKIQLKLAALALALSTINTPLSTCLAGGGLNPPGAPAPTMKSLDEIEPRTPISSVPFTITAPGSYYVTSNLTAGVNQNGILITTDNVTVDLNGFTLSGTGGTTGEGVDSSGARANIVVRNGTVRNWPGSGINLYDSGSSQVTVQNIHSISNVFSGIAVKNGSRVQDCVVLGNGTHGILVDNDSVVEHCRASGNAVFGGIGAGSTCQLLNNQSSGNAIGLSITGTGNIVANNLVRSNADNYSIAQGNELDLLLSDVPESIDWSAKVKLVGSLKVAAGNAITINANNVTLDLNGYSISSTENPASTGIGIFLNGSLQNITILNGFISGSVTNNGSGVYSGVGFARGIYNSGNTPANVLVSRVSVSGCLSDGINLGASYSFGPSSWATVESCLVETTGGIGIMAPTVKDSVARNCGSAGIFAHTVSDSYGDSRHDDGIDAVIAQNCGGASLSGDGIFADQVQNCIGSSSTGAGVSASSALNSSGSCINGNGLYGLYADVAMNCYGSMQNNSGGTGYGLYAAQSATGCYGLANFGTGLFAFIANVCHGTVSTGTALSATHNINSF